MYFRCTLPLLSLWCNCGKGERKLTGAPADSSHPRASAGSSEVLLLAALAAAASCAALGAATYVVLGAVATVATPYCICEMLKKYILLQITTSPRAGWNRESWIGVKHRLGWFAPASLFHESFWTDSPIKRFKVSLFETVLTNSRKNHKWFGHPSGS
jgi:hypothetical protein